MSLRPKTRGAAGVNRRSVFLGAFISAFIVMGWCSTARGQATNTQGWILGSEWNLLFPVLNSFGCNQGLTPENMQQPWVPPHNVPEEDPKAGDEWADVDWSQSPLGDQVPLLDDDGDPETPEIPVGYWDGGLGGTGGSSVPVWVDQTILQDVHMAFGGDGDVRGFGDLVNFQNMAVDLNDVAPGPDAPCNQCDGDSERPVANNWVSGIATTYVENTTGGPLLVGVCTSSDDSVAAWVNEVPLVVARECRGSGNRCDETSLVFLPAGVSKITMQVWEQGGGWNGRLRLLRPDGSPIVDGDAEIVFLGTGVDNPDAVTQLGTTQPGPAYERTIVRTDMATDAFGCPTPNPPPGTPLTVTLQELNGTGLQDQVITLAETIRPVDAELSNISNDGTVVLNMVPNSMTDEGFARPWNLAGPFVPAGSAPGNDAIRMDYITDGVETEDSFEYAPGATIMTDFGGAAASTGFQTGDTRDLNPGGVTTVVGFVSGDDTIDFNPDFYGADLNDNMVYGATYMFLENPVTDVRAAIASDDSIQVKIDGTEVIIHNGGRGFGGANSIQNRSGLLELSAGRHKVVCKVFEGGGGHGFRFRMENADGSPLTEGVRYCLDPAGVDCGEGTDGIRDVSQTIFWDVTRAEAFEGVSYDVTLGRDGNVTMSGEAVDDGVGVGGQSSQGFDDWGPQTGPVGIFDDSHNIFSGGRTGCDEETITTFNPDTGEYTHTGCGGDIWTGGDQFRFAYQRVQGDFLATMRITERSDPPGARWGKHGLMARQECTSNSRHMSTETQLAATDQNIEQNQMHGRRNHNDNNGSQFERRWDEDGGGGDRVFDSPDIHGRDTSSRPSWLALARHGKQFVSLMADQDENGAPKDWVFVGSETNDGFPEEILVGAYLTSHAGGTVGSITFDNMSIIPHEDAVLPDPSLTPVTALEETFDSDGPPAGATVNVVSGDFTPVNAGGRLRITEDGQNSAAVSVLYPVSGVQTDGGFTAEFDAFMFKAQDLCQSTAAPTGTEVCDDGEDNDGDMLVDCDDTEDCEIVTVANTAPPSTADGITFAVLEGTGEQADGAVGGGGGALGYDGRDGDAGSFRNAFLDEDRVSFAVEFDTWVGGGSNEPGGRGTNETDGQYHVGIDTNGQVTSVQQNVDFGVPDLPNIFDPAIGGVHVEVNYTPDAMTGLADVEVWVSANDGSSLRTKVLDTLVGRLEGDLLFGFTGGTGGANVRAEVDNFTITGLCPDDFAGTVSISPVPPKTVDVGSTVTLTASVDGGDGMTTFAWSAEGAGSIEGPADGESADVLCESEGTVTVTVVGDGNLCDDDASASVDIVCESAGGLRRPGDYDNDGMLLINDPINLFERMFRNVNLPLPCDGGLQEGGNLTLLDWNGDGEVNLADGVASFTFQFRDNTNVHALGRDCVEVEGCPDTPCMDEP